MFEKYNFYKRPFVKLLQIFQGLTKHDLLNLFFSNFFWQDTSNQEKGFRYEVAFDNITSKEDEYTVTISTELNGRTVTQTVEKFPMGQPDP